MASPTPDPAVSKPARHLRDAAKICPATSRLSNGYVVNRCELDVGHDGQHKDFCTRWSDPRLV